MTPGEITLQASMVLEGLDRTSGITNDPGELAAVLRVAAETCATVHTNNLLMTALRHNLNKL